MARVTTTGAQYKKFYADQSVWEPEKGHSWYLEDDLIIINDEEDVDIEELYRRYGDNLQSIPDDAKVVIEGGYMAWQGDGEPPEERGDLVAYFKKWDKRQSTIMAVATFELPKDIAPDKLEEIRATLLGLGAKLSGWPDAPKSSAPKPR